ncbi:hypothetical protein [Emticicia sp. BO119]|uniref:hypothetical protein n=1 Tax=Emticicia sp. BO119 TaxID=2757768 RepID=UPI0015F08DA4|nr:hypothetical protein [Emticicia sp. BO119]MBA4853990.1 hypothetical protein [Emticicia sp. BO119]
MAKELTSEELILDQQVKLEWNKPEAEVFSVKDKTLLGLGVGGDLIIIATAS